MYNTLRHWVCSGEQAEQCAAESCGLVHYLCTSTCTSTTQLLAHLHPGHLCSVPPPHHTPHYLCTPTSRPPTQHLFRFCPTHKYYTSMSVGGSCAPSLQPPMKPPPYQLSPSTIRHQTFCMWLCTAGPTILLKTPVCVVSPLPVCWAFACTICDLCLIGHLYYVSHQYCNYIRVFQVFGIRNICIILKHLPLIASNINSNRQWSTRNRGEDWATNRWAAFLQFNS